MTDSLAWPHELMTVAAWDALPEDAPRCELVEGSLLTTPSPLAGHQRAAFRVGRWLDQVFPVHHRPRRGARGHHRVQMRHGSPPCAAVSATSSA